MTIVKKLKLRNFKRFTSVTFDFNDDINIIVGDNECGKSSLLEAMEVCLNLSHRGRPLSPELVAELFNIECVNAYLNGDLSQNSLPELLIEAYVEGSPKLRGTNNTDGSDTEGLFVRICFDADLSDSYAAFISDTKKVSTLPVELYKVEWFSFAWDRLTQLTKSINCLFVDPARLHPTFGKSRYINSIINAAIDKNARATLNLSYRQLKVRFSAEEDVKQINEKLDAEKEVTDKPLKIVADISPTSSWESNLQLAVNDISFAHIGKGEQNQVQIKIAVRNKAKDVDIVMLEEPENHLSHINLVRLIGYIEEKNQKKQLFITTHSSYVLNKLSIGKLCLLSSGYTRLKDIDAETIKTLKRLPGYDTLRVVLARKVILVEGPSDELVLKRLYLDTHKCLPEHHGVDVIVVRGISFKMYLNIAKLLGHPVHVVKDNDGDYKKNITEWWSEFVAFSFMRCFSPTDDAQRSLEPALIEANGSSDVALDVLAKTMLSTQTYGNYLAAGDLDAKKVFFAHWYGVDNSGSRKVDSAMRIFDSAATINYPDYLKEAVKFGS